MLTQEIVERLPKFYPYQVGQKGNLQEWYHDWEDAGGTDHRHQSHWFGLHPGKHITPYNTPELAEACATTLILRGDKSTGWATGWRINLWAKLWNGNKAYDMLRVLLKYVDPDDMNGKRRGGGTYPIESRIGEHDPGVRNDNGSHGTDHRLDARTDLRREVARTTAHAEHPAGDDRRSSPRGAWSHRREPCRVHRHVC